MGPRDVDGDFIHSPYNHLRTWRGGEAAVITVILTHVVLRQEAHQWEWLDFSSLALGRMYSLNENKVTNRTWEFIFRVSPNLCKQPRTASVICVQSGCCLNTQPARKGQNQDVFVSKRLIKQVNGQGTPQQGHVRAVYGWQSKTSRRKYEHMGAEPETTL